MMALRGALLGTQEGSNGFQNIMNLLSKEMKGCYRLGLGLEMRFSTRSAMILLNGRAGFKGRGLVLLFIWRLKCSCVAKAHTSISHTLPLKPCTSHAAHIRNIRFTLSSDNRQQIKAYKKHCFFLPFPWRKYLHSEINCSHDFFVSIMSADCGYTLVLQGHLPSAHCFSQALCLSAHVSLSLSSHEGNMLYCMFHESKELISTG